MMRGSSVPFEQRYEMRNRLWNDGPHGGWVALDRVLNREVVINIPYRENDSRFLEMAQIRARLRHANLIPIYDLGTTKDGLPFFSEPYIKATDLWRLLRHHENKTADVTLVRLISYLLDMCKAVAFLHANGLLHLELYPGDVQIVPDSEEVFLVLDYFSLPGVTVQSEDADTRRAATICGRPAYMAPEQVPERSGQPDVHTDVYGLGGILFEILYGNPPNGSPHEPLTEFLAAIKARRGPPRPGTLTAPAARCPQLARRLEPIWSRALEYDRSARQVNVSAFVKEVEECVWRYSG